MVSATTDQDFDLIEQRGYDCDEVDAYVAQATAAIDELEARLAEALARAEELEARVGPIEDHEALLGRTLLLAEEAAAETIAEAERRAAERIAQAEDRAQALLEQAQTRAKALVAAAARRAATATRTGPAPATTPRRRAAATSDRAQERIMGLFAEYVGSDTATSLRANGSRPRLARLVPVSPSRDRRDEA
jgi:cell division septum initiation protein DivIVA